MPTPHSTSRLFRAWCLMVALPLILAGCRNEAERDTASSATDADSSGWVDLFNGKDLSGWTPKFRGAPLGENYLDTFRVEDGVLKVSYEKYSKFDARFGHLFYETEFSSYDLELEYRFTGKQCPGGPGWAFRNNGVMVHGQSAASMTLEQSFPASIEIQLLGLDAGDEGQRTTMNLCTPATNVVLNDKLDTRHCINSNSKSYPGDDWVKVRVEVRGHEVIRHFIGDTQVMEYFQPQLDPRDKDADPLLKARNGEKALEKGTISLQAESHPCEFRNIRLKRI